jgi:hypothetical protein
MVPTQKLEQLAAYGEVVRHLSTILRENGSLPQPTPEMRQAYLKSLLTVRESYDCPSYNISFDPAGEVGAQFEQQLKDQADLVAKQTAAFLRALDGLVAECCRQGAVDERILYTRDFQRLFKQPVSQPDGRPAVYVLGDVKSTPPDSHARGLLTDDELFRADDGSLTLVLGLAPGDPYDPERQPRPAPFYHTARSILDTRRWRARQLADEVGRREYEAQVERDRRMQWEASPAGQAAAQKAEVEKLRRQVADLEAAAERDGKAA